MGNSPFINNVWNSLTPAEKKRIEETLGVNLDTYTTDAERYGLLKQFKEHTQNNHGVILDDAYAPHRVIDVSYSEGKRNYLPAKAIKISRGNDLGAKVIESSRLFMHGAMKYTLVIAFTLTGAYVGFSAARHTDLADELRKMEENPIIQAYNIKNDMNNFQVLRELDFLGPGQKGIARGREILDQSDNILRKVEDTVDNIRIMVKDVPVLGIGADLIEKQQKQLRLYKQKREQYSLRLVWYTVAGSVSGLGLGAFFQGRIKKRRNKGNMG